MKIEDIVLVTDNNKGTEKNMLMTMADFLNEYVFDAYDTGREVAEAIVDLMESKNDKNHWSENYFVANKSVHAKFCSDKLQLVEFLQDADGRNEHISFDETGCSRECLDTIKSIGISVDGKFAGYMQFAYKKVEAEYSQGEILHNLNGSDYRVLERLSKDNLLLMSVDSGQFIVAVGTESFMRYPKGEEPTKDNIVSGIEWSHGRYYGYTPSEIDFAAIRREYGEARSDSLDDNRRTEVVKREYQIEIKEELARVETIQAETLGDAIDKAMELYYGEKIVLDAEDMKGVDFQPMRSEKTR